MSYTVEQIRQKLSTDEKWVRRALIRLHERQTLSEQSSEATICRNGQGFTPADAKWLSRMAEFVTKFPDRTLSVKQLAMCGIKSPGFTGYVKLTKGEPCICKYAGQLARIIEEDAKARPLPTREQEIATYAAMESATEAAMGASL